MVKNIKKVKTVENCQELCQQSDICDFFRWKVDNRLFTLIVNIPFSEQQERTTEKVPDPTDPVQGKEGVVFWTQVLLGAHLKIDEFNKICEIFLLKK